LAGFVVGVEAWSQDRSSKVNDSPQKSTGGHFSLRRVKPGSSKVNEVVEVNNGVEASRAECKEI
jgi:hypothetical protein